MIHFFRRIRQGLLSQNRFSKYLLYAIGEILLVVVGILIALSINNWNQKNLNTVKERRYLNDLIRDLEKDSVALYEIKKEIELAEKSKRSFEAYLDGRIEEIDSISIHFDNQWTVTLEFSPNSITIDELRNSSNFDLIKNLDLRRQIVNLYNNYDQLLLKFELGTIKNQELMDIGSRYVNNIFNVTTEEAYNLLNNTYFSNKVRSNYIYSIGLATNKAVDNCISLISNLRLELGNKIND